MAYPDQDKHFLFRWIDTASATGGNIASACMIAVTCIIVFEVIMRYCFNSPTVWVGEMSIYLCMGVGFLSLAYGLKHNVHFSITFLTDRLTDKTRIRLKIFTDFIGMLYSSVFIHKGIEQAWFAYEMEDISSGMMETPLWIPWSFVPIGGFLLTLQFINKLAEDVKNLREIS